MIESLNQRLAIANFISKRLRDLSNIERHIVAHPLDAFGASEALSEFLSNLMSDMDFSISHPVIEDLSFGQNGELYPTLNKILREIYGAPFAHIVTGGSSISNLIMLGIIAKKYRPDKSIILVDQKAAHQSVTGGLVINGHHVAALERKKCGLTGIYQPLKAEEVKRAIKEPGAHNISCIQYTACNYEGYRDVLSEQAIINIARDANILVCIDGAWSASHGILPGTPPPLHPFADCLTLSTHKKGFTAGPLAAVLLANQRLDELFKEATSLGFMTTSPSYPLKLVSEYRLQCLKDGKLDSVWSKLTDLSHSIRQTINNDIDGARVVNVEDVGATHVDPSHLLVDISECRLNGRGVAERLYREFGIVTEKSTSDSVLFLLGPEHLNSKNLLLEGLDHVLKNQMGT